MILTDLFSGGQLKNTATQRTDTQPVTNRSGDTAAMNRQMQALKPGQTLQGEVVSKDGNQVQIKLADDFVVEARVDQDMNLQVGKNMTFEVRGNGQSLTLSPLFANTATQANALKALDMASLPVNQNTVSMTGLMMNAGLSIDRSSLQQMFREINAFPNANISDVVDLHKLGMAVNEENLTQISSYKNLTHQLVEGMHTVLEALPEGMEQMISEGNVEGAARMFQDMLDMLGELPEETAVVGEQTGEAQEAGAETLAAENGAAQEAAGAKMAGITEGELPVPQTQIAEALQEAENGMLPPTMDANTADTVLELLQNAGGDDTAYKALAEQFSQAVENGSAQDVAQAMKDVLSQGIQDKNQPLLEALLHNKGAQKFLADGMSKLWSIEPKDVADPGKVEELYARLNRQLNHLSKTLEESGQTQSKAFQAVHQMNQNIDFLNQLNQAYTYVQLPLHLQQGDAHGDLYVYTNKRNLAAKDGQISALLHLDMEHLGPVDVYVAMQAEKVSTRFYVQDDEMLDFLEAHMDLLTSRLEK
ncbi:MAG: flagellar hook-length control protein FliK [Lachnospiraceae bacterium]|nr:flagellar hook-length control protein FliK [Lachnospiraceae bacterium]